jgi:hypothetical protein
MKKTQQSLSIKEIQIKTTSHPVRMAIIKQKITNAFEEWGEGTLIRC